MKKPLSISMAGILLIMSVSFAQEPEPPTPSDTPVYQYKWQIQEKIRTMKMWKLTETLELTEEQALKFFPMFKDFEKKVQAIRDENSEYLKKLNGYIMAGDEGAKMTDLINKIENNEMEILKARTQFRKDAKKILDKTQIAKLVIFQHDFPRRFRDAIHERQFRGSGRAGRPRGYAPGGQRMRSCLP